MLYGNSHSYDFGLQYGKCKLSMDEVRTSHRLCRPHFEDKSDKIEHKAALSQKWHFILTRWYVER